MKEYYDFLKRFTVISEVENYPYGPADEIIPYINKTGKFSLVEDHQIIEYPINDRDTTRIYILERKTEKTKTIVLFRIVEESTWQMTQLKDASDEDIEFILSIDEINEEEE
jgi:hypothetical protein